MKQITFDVKDWEFERQMESLTKDLSILIQEECYDEDVYIRLLDIFLGYHLGQISALAIALNAHTGTAIGLQRLVIKNKINTSLDNLSEFSSVFKNFKQNLDEPKVDIH